MGAVEIAQQKEKERERGNADDSKHSTTTTMIKMTVPTKYNGAQTGIDEEQSPEICRYIVHLFGYRKHPNRFKSRSTKTFFVFWNLNITELNMHLLTDDLLTFVW